MTHSALHAAGQAPADPTQTTAAALQALVAGSDVRAAIAAWLKLICTRQQGVQSALVLLRLSPDDQLKPAGVWPQTQAVPAGLRAVCESATRKQTGVMRQADALVHLAWPCSSTAGGQAVVGCTLAAPAAERPDAFMTDLQLQAGWLEALLYRSQEASEEEERDLSREAVDLVAGVVDEAGFESSARALVTDLAVRADCDRVSLTVLRRGRPQVVAMSHAATFSRSMDLVTCLVAAVEEALDQATALAWPLLDDEAILVTEKHEQLARAHGAGAVLTVPLVHGDQTFGALVLEANDRAKLTDRLARLLEGAGALLAPVLQEKHANDRWLVQKVGTSSMTQLKRLVGPHYLGRKAVVAGLAAVAAFAYFATGTATVVADARLEGRVQRAIVAPFDGYVLSEHARAGQIVERGEPLATLDDRDLRLERLRYEAGREQRQLEMQQALAEGRRADINVTRAKIQEANAQIDLLDEMIRRAVLNAPFDGLVATGDLSQKVGTPVARGDQLFKVTPLDGYRVVLSVPESRIAVVEAGQAGQVRFAAFPERNWPVTVESVTPVTEVRDGDNVFRVEARIGDEVGRLRPGMEGVVRLDGPQRRLVAIWLRPAWDWLRLTLWRWMP